jgi:hypothetical protein
MQTNILNISKERMCVFFFSLFLGKAGFFPFFLSPYGLCPFVDKTDANPGVLVEQDEEGDLFLEK